MPPLRRACVLSQMWCVNIAMSMHAPCWRRPARRRRDWLIMCQFCNAFCITQRKEAKNARVQFLISEYPTKTAFVTRSAKRARQGDDDERDPASCGDELR